MAGSECDPGLSVSRSCHTFLLLSRHQWHTCRCSFLLLDYAPRKQSAHMMALSACK